MLLQVHEAIGRSKGGLTTKIVALIEGVAFGALIADKAFDANWIITELNKRGAGIVISKRS